MPADKKPARRASSKKTPSKKDRTLHKLRHFHSLVSENTRTQGDEEEQEQEKLRN